MAPCRCICLWSVFEGGSPHHVVYFLLPAESHSFFFEYCARKLSRLGGKGGAENVALVDELSRCE
jgi:hypothetical protein